MSGNQDLLTAVKQHFKTNDVVTGKGGFFVRGHGHISTAKARSLTGVEAEPRHFKPRQQAWGDYATIAMLNQPRKSTMMKDVKSTRTEAPKKASRDIYSRGGTLSRRTGGRRVSRRGLVR